MVSWQGWGLGAGNVFEDATFGDGLPSSGYCCGVPQKARKPQELIRFEVPTNRNRPLFLLSTNPQKHSILPTAKS